MEKRGRTLEPFSHLSSSRSLSRDSLCSLSSTSSFSSSHSLSPVRNTCKEIIINGLSRNVTSAHLKEIFSAYGVLKEVSLNDEEMNYKRDAIVKFDTGKAATLSIECMNGGQIDGMDVTVNYYEPKTCIERNDSNISKAPIQDYKSYHLYSNKLKVTPRGKHHNYHSDIQDNYHNDHHGRY